jgi:ribosome-binding protein aMBF1 (putative translation factor)
MTCELCGVSIDRTNWYIIPSVSNVKVCDGCMTTVLREVYFAAPIQLIRDAIETIRCRRNEVR